jgi:hypothetical protein
VWRIYSNPDPHRYELLEDIGTKPLDKDVSTQYSIPGLTDDSSDSAILKVLPDVIEKLFK